MLRPIFFSLLAVSAIAARAWQPQLHESAIGPAYAATSVNTAIFRANPLATHDSTQYACYYDPQGRVTLAMRRLGTDVWRICPTPYSGHPDDAHNVISIGVDGVGTLHMAFDHHGHPLHYCRAEAAAPAAVGPLMPMTGLQGEDNVTYPEFHRLPDGDLLFVFRSGASGRGDMVINRYITSERRWVRVHDVLLDGENERSAYWQMHVDAAGTIHLSWVWRESWIVETNHDICYARSRDGGVTWERSDGSPYALPVTMATAEVACAVPQNSELINQCSMSADAEGHPMIAAYWRDSSDSVPRYRLVEHDGRSWRTSVVTDRSTPFSLKGGGTKMIPVSRPRVVADTSTGAVVYLFRDAERGSRVSAALRRSKNAPWEIADLTDYSVDAWEPAIDSGLWSSEQTLHIYVQRAGQGDGERTTSTPPQTARVLELTLPTAAAQ